MEHKKHHKHMHHKHMHHKHLNKEVHVKCLRVFLADILAAKHGLYAVH